MQTIKGISRGESATPTMDSRGKPEISPDDLRATTKQDLESFIQSCPKHSTFDPLKRKLMEFSRLLDSEDAKEIGYLRALLKQLSQETDKFTQIDENQAQWDAASRREDRIAPHRFKNDLRNKIAELLKEASSFK